MGAKIMLAYTAIISLATATNFEKLSVSHTQDSTTVTLRAHIPTGYLQPRLINCVSTGTNLTCDLKAQKPEAGLPSMGNPIISHVLEAKLPYKTDIWSITVQYDGQKYKA
ncbi:MAG: hypothetical protein KF820_00095 [Candidatus Paracaedibacteraceae bacterium]|nr:hypothetical protein [Candidatus Paracaedibacteraceae bacterium]